MATTRLAIDHPPVDLNGKGMLPGHGPYGHGYTELVAYRSGFEPIQWADGVALLERSVQYLDRYAEAVQRLADLLGVPLRSEEK